MELRLGLANDVGATEENIVAIAVGYRMPWVEATVVVVAKDVNVQEVPSHA